ncbi:hypothetical protein TW65_09329 [Stemphylium lycopersici]|nr:hypothetical protein TW65_09329 [Stemphylium lycopersici]
MQNGTELIEQRWLEGTNGNVSHGSLPIDPYTHNTKPSLYDTSRRLLSDVCHLQGRRYVNLLHLWLEKRFRIAGLHASSTGTPLISSHAGNKGWTGYATKPIRGENSQGLLNLTKGDFFPLFWSSWTSVFKPPLIKRSFEATGIHPANLDAALKKFAKEASDSDSSQSVLSGEDWLKLKSIVRREVKDQSSKDVKKLERSLHHIAAQNSILREEVRGLRDSLAIKKRRDNKPYTLQLESNQGYHGGAVFWSPKRVQQARDDEVSRQQQAVQQQLQKAEITEMKEQARLCKLQLLQEKRVERERRQEVRRKEIAAKLAEKQHQKRLRDAKKSYTIAPKG